MKKVFVGALFLALQIAYAQNNENYIDKIEITGKFQNTLYKKVNENIEVITKADIQNSSAKSIDEILQRYAGMDIRRRGANGVQSDVSVRGGTFEETLILLNGIKMNDSQTGHNSMNIPVDLSNVERIEIVKGPASRRYGNGAYSVINIITKSESDEKVKISAQGGDYKSYGLGLSSTFGNDKFSNLFQANTSSSAGYRHNTDCKIQNIFYQNQYKITNGNIGLMAGFSDKKFGANGFYASPSATEQYEETQASVVALKYEQSFGKFDLKSNLYWRRGQDMYVFIRDKPSVYRNMHIGNNLGGEIDGSYNWMFGTTNLGLELRKEILVSNNLGDRNRFLTQVFFEHHFSLINSKLQIVPGITWSNYSDSGNFFYPGIDVGFDIDDHHKIYGNLSKVHRIPTFTDLYYVSRTEQGNPKLEPENAVSSEIGYRFINKNVLAKISGFMRNSSNSIDWLKVTPSSIWTAQNVGEINMKGIELEFRQNLTDWFNYSLGYTYIDSDQAIANSQISRYSLQNLKHQFIATTNFKFLKNFSNQWTYRYDERKNSISYNLLDTKLTYQQKNFDIYLLINNVTNTNYTETFGVPMPKRWFFVGLDYTIR